MSALVPSSRCPRCGTVVVPAAAYCPNHPVAMHEAAVDGRGRVLSFTTLHAVPEGFRSPLQIALVELDDGGRLVCHGGDLRHLRIGAPVTVDKVDEIYYLANLTGRERVRRLWRRARGWTERARAFALPPWRFRRAPVLGLDAPIRQRREHG